MKSRLTGLSAAAFCQARAQIQRESPSPTGRILAKTASPCLKRVTRFPVSTTTPARSLPRVAGAGADDRLKGRPWDHGIDGIQPSRVYLNQYFIGLRRRPGKYSDADVVAFAIAIQDERFHICLSKVALFLLVSAERGSGPGPYRRQASSCRSLQIPSVQHRRQAQICAAIATGQQGLRRCTAVAGLCCRSGFQHDVGHNSRVVSGSDEFRHLAGEGRHGCPGVRHA